MGSTSGPATSTSGPVTSTSGPATSTSGPATSTSGPTTTTPWSTGVPTFKVNPDYYEPIPQRNDNTLSGLRRFLRQILGGTSPVPGRKRRTSGDPNDCCARCIISAAPSSLFPTFPTFPAFPPFSSPPPPFPTFPPVASKFPPFPTFPTFPPVTRPK